MGPLLRNRSRRQPSTSPAARRDLFASEFMSGMYDETIRMVVPSYDYVHHLLLALLRENIARSASTCERASPLILDVGAGTGTETMAVLAAYPSAFVVAVDVCRPMCDLLEAKLGDQESFVGRYLVHCADIVGAECSVRLLRRSVSTSKPRYFDAVISAFALHHLSHQEKRRAFRRIAGVLRPGGLFLNADLFSYQDKALARLALSWDLEYIKREFRTSGCGLDSENRERLIAHWTRHYETDNLTEPIEDTHSSETVEKIRPGQASMLRDAGFRTVAVPFRQGQLGLLWARKA